MRSEKYTMMRIKLVTLFCLALAMGVTNMASAQSGNVSFPTRSITIKEAFGEITRQAGYLFAYNNTVIDDSRVVALSKQSFIVTEAMDELLKGTGNTFEIKGSHILIVAGKQSQPTQPSKRVKPTAPARHTGSEWDRDWTSSTVKPVNQQREIVKVEKTMAAEVVQEVAAVEEKKTEPPVVKTEPVTQSEPVKTESAPIVREEKIVPPQETPTITTISTVAGNPRSSLRSERYGMKAPAFASIKTNLLYGGVTFTPNLSVEIGLGRQTSLDLWGSYHPWKPDESQTDPRKLEHWIIRPEFRYWLSERSSGHFFGFHGFYSEYNIVGVKIPQIFDKEFRYEGSLYGGGITYGYHLKLSKHWGMEFSVSGGGGYFEYDKYPRGVEPVEKIGRFTKTYIGPTGAGIKLVFIIK